MASNERVFKNLGVTIERSRNQILVEFGFRCQNVFAWMAFKDVRPSVILLWWVFSFHQVFAYIDRLHFSLYVKTKVDINGFLLPTAGPAQGSKNQLMCSKVEAPMAHVQSQVSLCQKIVAKRSPAPHTVCISRPRCKHLTEWISGGQSRHFLGSIHYLNYPESKDQR